MAGVVAGEHPTAPSSFVIRGFTENQVSTLRDGIWLGPSTMIMRPQNTFNLDRVELLRGPSSVINGQGAVAGTINAVTKSAEPMSAMRWQGLASYDRFTCRCLYVGVVCVDSRGRCMIPADPERRNRKCRISCFKRGNICESARSRQPWQRFSQELSSRCTRVSFLHPPRRRSAKMSRRFCTRTAQHAIALASSRRCRY